MSRKAQNVYPSHVSNVKFLMTGGLTETQNNCFLWVATPKPTAFQNTTEGSVNQAARPQEFRRLGLKGPTLEITRCNQFSWRADRAEARASELTHTARRQPWD